MSVTAPYSALERSLSVLLSPLDHPDWQTWQKTVHTSLLDLTDADALCIYTPLGDGPDTWYAPHLSASALGDYAHRAANDASWDVIETGFTRLAARTGRTVAHESEFIEDGSRRTSAFHHDFLAPHRLNDLTVASASFGGLGAARLHFSNQDWRGDAEQQERQQRVRTVLPALKSGLALWRQLGHRRAELAYVFDALHDAVLLYDANTRLVHANPSATRMFESTNGLTLYDSERLRSEAVNVAQRINTLMKRTGLGAPTVSTSAASREVRLSSGTIVVHGAIAPSWMFGRDHGVIVTLEHLAPRPVTDAELRARFGLTARELEVARHVADGMSNQALAEHLGVSFFTARNHVEKVLGKLDARNRAHVGAKLRELRA